jgi:NADH-quinone oxidoreductase subunit J
MNITFYICAAVAIIATAMVITGKNAVHSLLYFIVSLLAAGIIFFIIGAPFVAVLVVIINAGAIMVLFVFVIMMLNLGPQSIELEKSRLNPGGWVGPVFLTMILLAELVYALLSHSAVNPKVELVDSKAVGMALFGPYLLGVELASILLLAGLLGAYHLGRKSADDGEGNN